MGILRILILSLFALAATTSCSVISRQMRTEAEPISVPFKTLVADADKYIGHTVILGGYILETRNLKSETTLKVLQVPFRFGDEPDTKDRSQGRFIVHYRGFWDPEVYKKGRVITVAGKVIGSVVERIGAEEIKYLKIENREIYLWPDYNNHTPYYYPHPYPYYWYRYPYYGYPYRYW